MTKFKELLESNFDTDEKYRVLFEILAEYNDKKMPSVTVFLNKAKHSGLTPQEIKKWYKEQ